MSEITDSNKLAYSGTLPTPEEVARRVRRRGYLGYAEHYLRTMRAFGLPLLLESVLTPLLYLVAMGVGLGALVDRGVGQVQGVSYLAFVGPALMIATATMGAATESMYPVMSGFKWQRLYLGAVATPMSPAQIATGHLLGACARYLFQAVVFWIYLVAFGAVHGVRSVLLVPIAILSAVAFGAPLQAYSAQLKDEGASFNFVQRFVVMPMSLFAGTFFPLSAMPVYLQWIGWVSPIWHGSQLARRVGFGMPEPAWLTGVHLAYLVALVVVGVLLSRRIYTRRLGE